MMAAWQAWTARRISSIARFGRPAKPVPADNSISYGVLLIRHWARTMSGAWIGREGMRHAPSAERLARDLLQRRRE